MNPWFMENDGEKNGKFIPEGRKKEDVAIELRRKVGRKLLSVRSEAENRRWQISIGFISYFLSLYKYE